MCPTRPGQIDRPGNAHADADHVVAGEPGLVEHGVHELDRGVERRGRRVVDVELDPPLGEHGRREIRDGDPEVVVPEVDAERRAGGRVETEQRRRPAAARRARCRLTGRLLDDEPTPLQLRDERGDRRPRETGQSGELAPARRALLSQSVSITRNLFRSRNPSREPVLVTAATFSPFHRLCQESGEIREISPAYFDRTSA